MWRNSANIKSRIAHETADAIEAELAGVSAEHKTYADECAALVALGEVERRERGACGSMEEHGEQRPLSEAKFAETKQQQARIEKELDDLRWRPGATRAAAPTPRPASALARVSACGLATRPRQVWALCG